MSFLQFRASNFTFLQDITTFLSLTYVIIRTIVLQEHVQGFRQPTELSSLLTYGEIIELDRVTNRYLTIKSMSNLLLLVMITAAVPTVSEIAFAYIIFRTVF